MTFKANDHVRLKSRGAEMIVNRIEQIGELRWFIVCGLMKIMRFSVRRFRPMFWNMQNQNNPLGSQVALAR